MATRRLRARGCHGRGSYYTRLSETPDYASHQIHHSHPTRFRTTLAAMDANIQLVIDELKGINGDFSNLPAVSDPPSGSTVLSRRCPPASVPWRPPPRCPRNGNHTPTLQWIISASSSRRWCSRPRATTSTTGRVALPSADPLSA